jgi:hypothetical protein
MLFIASATLVLAMSHNIMGVPSDSLQLRQADDWDEERPTGLECDAQIQPKFDDCMLGQINPLAPIDPQS